MMDFYAMAVALLNPLPKIAFSKNPIWVRLQSDDYLSTAGVKAVGSLTFTGSVVAGQVITLKWGSVTVNLMAIASPDDSGMQIPTGDGSAAYAQSLVPLLDQVYVINRDFVVSWDGSKILFTAREFGSSYSFIGGTYLSAQVQRVTAGLAKQLKPNFAHHLEVWVEKADGSAFQKCYDHNIELDQPIDAGVTTVNIAETLDGYLSLDEPNLNASVFASCNKSIRRYYIKFGQYYGDRGEVKKLTTSATFSVLLGGFSNMALRKISDISTYLEKLLLPEPTLYKFQRWLETYQIDKFNVKTNEVRYLYFINNRDVAETLKLNVAVNFDSGAPITKVIAGLAVQPLKKISVAVGYKQLGLEAYTTSTRKVVSYEVQLVENTSNEARSLVKYFTVDRAYENYTRYFLFADSAGNFKTLRTWGKSALTSEISRDVAIKDTDVASIPVKGNYENYNISSVQNDTVYTGYLSDPNEYDNLNDLMLSSKVYRVIGGSLVPAIITGKKFNYAADGVTLLGYKIEYQLAFEEELYTGDSPALDIPKLNRAQQALNDI